MKRQNSDKSAPYRTLGLDKVTAPKKPTDAPKSAKITSSEDLRSKRAK